MSHIKLMTTCPYCKAAQERDKLHNRFYSCGTTANRDTKRYIRG